MPVAPPGDHKVQGPVGPLHHHNGQEGHGFRQEHMVHRHQNLLGVQPKLHRDLFQGVNGRAVDIRLAGCAQTTVAHRLPMALQQAGERCWSAVHGGRLHHLWRKAAAA
jgi:hypothetical protein